MAPCTQLRNACNTHARCVQACQRRLHGLRPRRWSAIAAVCSSQWWICSTSTHVCRAVKCSHCKAHRAADNRKTVQAQVIWQGVVRKPRLRHCILARHCLCGGIMKPALGKAHTLLVVGAAGAAAAAAAAAAGQEVAAAPPMLHLPEDGNIAAVLPAAAEEHLEAVARHVTVETDASEWHISTPPRSSTLRPQLSSDSDAADPGPHVAERRPRKYSSSGSESHTSYQPVPWPLTSQGHKAPAEEDSLQQSLCGTAGLLDMPWGLEGLEHLVGQLTDGAGVRHHQLQRGCSTGGAEEEPPAAPRPQQQRRHRLQLLDTSTGAPFTPCGGAVQPLVPLWHEQAGHDHTGSGTGAEKTTSPQPVSTSVASNPGMDVNGTFKSRRRLAVGLDVSTLTAHCAPDDLTAPSGNSDTLLTRSSHASQAWHHSDSVQSHAHGMRSSTTCPNLHDPFKVTAEQPVCYKPTPPKMPNSPSSPASPKPGLTLRRAATCAASPLQRHPATCQSVLASNVSSPKGPLSTTKSQTGSLQALPCSTQQAATYGANTQGAYVALPPITHTSAKTLPETKATMLVIQDSTENTGATTALPMAPSSSTWHPADEPAEAPRALLQTPGLAGSFRNRSSCGFAHTSTFKSRHSSQTLGAAACTSGQQVDASSVCGLTRSGLLGVAVAPYECDASAQAALAVETKPRQNYVHAALAVPDAHSNIADGSKAGHVQRVPKDGAVETTRSVAAETVHAVYTTPGCERSTLPLIKATSHTSIQ